MAPLGQGAGLGRGRGRKDQGCGRADTRSASTVDNSNCGWSPIVHRDGGSSGPSGGAGGCRNHGVGADSLSRSAPRAMPFRVDALYIDPRLSRTPLDSASIPSTNWGKSLTGWMASVLPLS
jgi:hypothetical protein